MRTSPSLVVGKTYTRKQIYEHCGGDLFSYLPHADGKVVCGCFDLGLSQDAPDRVAFGDGLNVTKYAYLLLQQQTAVPIFIKRSPNHWEYVGNYRAVKIATDSKSLHPSATKRDDAVGVLHLEKSAANHEDGNTGANDLPDIDLEFFEAHEGRTKLVTHLKRERDPRLAKRKKLSVLRRTGRLICEVCDFQFTSIPELGEACCEVHHTRPLAARDENEITKLQDLVILCSNCHRMIHRGNPLFSVKQLRQRVKKTNYR